MTIFYDGASRPRAEVIAAVERDALAFVAQKVEDFSRDGSAWWALMETIDVPATLDPFGELPPEILSGPPTMSWSPRVTVEEDRVTIALVKYFPKQAAAMHAAFAAKPWCASATLAGTTLKFHLRNLDACVAKRVASHVASAADRQRRSLRRGVAALLAFIDPDAPASIANAQRAALAEIDRIEEANLAHVRSVQ